MWPPRASFFPLQFRVCKVHERRAASLLVGYTPQPHLPHNVSSFTFITKCSSIAADHITIISEHTESDTSDEPPENRPGFPTFAAINEIIGLNRLCPFNYFSFCGWSAKPQFCIIPDPPPPLRCKSPP